MTNWTAKRNKAGSKFIRQGLKTAMDPSVGNMALLAYRGVKGLRAIVNSEAMQIDTGIAISTVANTPVVYQLNAIAQGDTVSQRTGHSCLMSSLHSTEYYVSSVANVLVREVLVLDKQQIADTAPAWLDVFENSNPASLYNKLSKSRFQILEDKTFVLSQTQRSNKFSKKTRKLHKHAIFNGTASTDIQKNGLYKMIIADGVVGTSNGYRLFYHDN